MKKIDIQFQTWTKQDKLCQGTQWTLQEHSERRNPASNHSECHEDVTRHCQPKRTRGTQKIPRQ
jgi:hypothetical protein